MAATRHRQGHLFCGRPVAQHNQNCNVIVGEKSLKLVRIMFTHNVMPIIVLNILVKHYTICQAMAKKNITDSNTNILPL